MGLPGGTRSELSVETIPADGLTRARLATGARGRVAPGGPPPRSHCAARPQVWAGNGVAFGSRQGRPWGSPVFRSGAGQSAGGSGRPAVARSPEPGPRRRSDPLHHHESPVPRPDGCAAWDSPSVGALGPRGRWVGRWMAITQRGRGRPGRHFGPCTLRGTTPPHPRVSARSEGAAGSRRWVASGGVGSRGVGWGVGSRFPGGGEVHPGRGPGRSDKSSARCFADGGGSKMSRWVGRTRWVARALGAALGAALGGGFLGGTLGLGGTRNGRARPFDPGVVGALGVGRRRGHEVPAVGPGNFSVPGARELALGPVTVPLGGRRGLAGPTLLYARRGGVGSVLGRWCRVVSRPLVSGGGGEVAGGRGGSVRWTAGVGTPLAPLLIK